MSIQKFIQFGLGEETFAIPLLKVREVISTPETTPIPKAPSHFVGLMNLRGHVITIMDLRMKMKIKPAEYSEEEAVIIVDMHGVHVGLIVDSINRVLSIETDELTLLPELEGQFNAGFIDSVYKNEKDLTIILNLENVLDMKEQSIIKSA